MKYKLLIDPEREEEITVVVHERNELCERIEALLQKEEKSLLGYSGSEIECLDVHKVTCFFAEDGHVWAKTAQGRYQIRERLYQLEACYAADFLKINQSCLVNAKKIKKFEVSFGGGLAVILEDGYRDFVSRRQLKTVKERMGL